MSNITVELLEHQKQGSKILAESSRKLVIYPTGKGKTLTALAASSIITSRNRIPIFVVAPKSAVTSWQDDLLKIPSYKFSLYGSDYDKIPDVTIIQTTKVKSFVLSNYHFVKGHSYILIIDEVDVFSNPNTASYEYTKVLSYNALYCWGLTASPIGKHLEHTYHFIDLVYKRNPFGSLNKFYNDYTISERRDIYRYGKKYGSYNQIIEYINKDHLSDVIKSLSIMSKSDSKIFFKFLNCDLTEEELKSYKQLAKDSASSDTPAAFLHSLQKNIDGCDSGDSLSSKESLLNTILPEMKARGNPFILYVSYHETLERLKPILSNNGIEFFSISGKATISYRRKVIKALDSGWVGCILVTTSGTRGVNLQLCESTIIYNIPEIKTLIQLLGRQSRIGSPFDQNYVFFISANETIDQYKASVTKTYSNLVLSIVNGSAILPDDDPLSVEAVIKSRKKLLWGKTSKKTKK